jgi:hypothetical protein
MSASAEQCAALRWVGTPAGGPRARVRVRTCAMRRATHRTAACTDRATREPLQNTLLSSRHDPLEPWTGPPKAVHTLIVGSRERGGQDAYHRRAADPTNGADNSLDVRRGSHFPWQISRLRKKPAGVRALLAGQSRGQLAAIVI